MIARTGRDLLDDERVGSDVTDCCPIGESDIDDKRPTSGDAGKYKSVNETVDFVSG